MISNCSFEIGQNEKKAIVEADYCGFLPGSHIELGIAIGNSKKIHLYSIREVDNLATKPLFATYLKLKSAFKFTGAFTISADM
ncbi:MULTISPECIES: hypothetical protein [Bacillus]|uniref:hypothetical protein n=1 Tax=Bacillus TaxID=1386 RepID=UPI001E5A3581|nr:hypothetical protein [Bacillus rhizoplanae]